MSDLERRPRTAPGMTWEDSEAADSFRRKLVLILNLLASRSDLLLDLSLGAELYTPSSLFPKPSPPLPFSLT